MNETELREAQKQRDKLLSEEHYLCWMDDKPCQTLTSVAKILKTAANYIDITLEQYKVDGLNSDWWAGEGAYVRDLALMAVDSLNGKEPT